MPVLWPEVACGSKCRPQLEGTGRIVSRPIVPVRSTRFQPGTSRLLQGAVVDSCLTFLGDIADSSGLPAWAVLMTASVI